MFFRLRQTQNMENFVTVCLQIIGDQSAMASPPNRFGAHDCHMLVADQFDQLFDSVRKSLALHIIGITSKCFISPRRIARIGSRSSSPTELEQMVVLDSNLGERLG